MAPVAELTFRRTMINIADAGRLGEGEDLNDALLDFFTKLGQALLPKGGEEKAPVAYLGSIFFKQLRSAFATSGEEGWKNVQNWAKRKAGGLYKPNYAAFAVPINEDLKDDKGQDAGNHWWLALLLNPPGGAKKEPTAVMCLDSMQRREKTFEPALKYALEGSLNKYNVNITKMEQAGFLVIISFMAYGDGSMGPLQRPEASRLVVDNIEISNPTLGLRVNMPASKGNSGTFEGTLTFSMDGRCRSSTFYLHYGEGGFPPIKLEFDPFMLTKLQKDVSRFLGGYLAKEWEVNGPARTQRFEKQSARALVADVYQQENLNDCGVFVLENTLRSLSMKPDFLKHMASASPEVLKTFPWPSQSDITARKAKLKAIVARLFAAGAEKGTSDVDKLMKDDEQLKAEVISSLTENREDELDKWSGNLVKELAARQVDKDMAEAEIRKREEAVQAKREEERLRREEEQRKAEEERLAGKRPPGKKREESDSDDSDDESEKAPPPKAKKGSEKKNEKTNGANKKAAEKKGKNTKKKKEDSSEEEEEDSEDDRKKKKTKKKEESDSEEDRKKKKVKKAPPPKKKRDSSDEEDDSDSEDSRKKSKKKAPPPKSTKGSKKKGREASRSRDSRSRSESRSEESSRSRSRSRGRGRK